MYQLQEEERMKRMNFRKTSMISLLNRVFSVLPCLKSKVDSR